MIRSALVGFLFFFFISFRPAYGVDVDHKLKSLQSEYRAIITPSMTALPTSILYFNRDSDEYLGKFKDVRRVLSAKYQGSYLPRRQLLQDEIVKHFLASGASSVLPSVIFSAGPMGAGKSSVLSYLDSKDQLNLSEFVMIDMDRIRFMLPEIYEYIKADPETAGEKTQNESAYIQELIFLAALKKSRNVIVDGTMKDTESHLGFFSFIREFYPHYRIEIYSVQTDPGKIFRRIAQREGQSFRENKMVRVVPRSVVLESIHLTSESIEILKEYADRTLYFDNNNETPKLVYEYIPSN